jgi:hypothetical protein
LSRRSAISSGPTASESSLAINHELVAAHPSDSVALAHDGGQSRRDRLQEFVARGMAERVVDRLEVIEVDEQGGERRLLATRAQHQLLDAIEDQRPIRQPGERVVGRQKRELALAALELLIRALAL